VAAGKALKRKLPKDNQPDDPDDPESGKEDDEDDETYHESDVDKDDDGDTDDEDDDGDTDDEDEIIDETVHFDEASAAGYPEYD